MRAYHVTESVKGEALYLVYAQNADEAANKIRDGERENEVQAIDRHFEPGGIRRVRRAPDEDDQT